jgi:hypothetical protein
VSARIAAAIVAACALAALRNAPSKLQDPHAW